NVAASHEHAHQDDGPDNKKSRQDADHGSVRAGALWVTNYSLARTARRVSVFCRVFRHMDAHNALDVGTRMGTDVERC
ncbi:hypothetical protein AB4Y88_06365, partial [Paenarthrobacter sp. RAF9]